MIIDRGLLLSRLNEASIGLSTSKETTEQSGVFAFENGFLTTFNGEIMVRVQSPLDFDVTVSAVDLWKLIEKIPDAQIKVWLDEGKFWVQSITKDEDDKCEPTREYWTAVEAQNSLPIDMLPQPAKWSRLMEGTVTHLIQAARICSKEDDDYLTKLVHVTPNFIESTDNNRFFRMTAPTGFPGDTLMPAASMLSLKGLELTKVSFAEGWAYFRTSSGGLLAVRSVLEEYHDDIDSLMEMKDAHAVTLPQNLAEMVGLAEIFTESTVSVQIDKGKLTLTATKDHGGATERKKLAYKGPPIHFQVNPKFLVEILEKTRDVLVGNGKMKMTSGSIQFIVALEMPEDFNKE